MGIGALAVLACLIATAPAVAARDARLSLKKVGSPPERAAPGDSFAVRGKLVNKGDQGTRLKLKAELRGAGVDYRLGEDRTKIGADDRKRFGFEVEVPGHVDEGEVLKLAVCVRRHGKSGAQRCRKAKDRLTIAGPTTPPTPPGPPTPYVAGSRSLGDPLLPQLGNGG